MTNRSAALVPVCGLILGGAVLGAIALHEQAAEVITGPRSEPMAVEIVTSEPVDEVDVPRIVDVAPVASPIDRADPRQYGFVIQIGGTSYVQLTTDAEETAVARGRAKLVDDEGALSAVATIRASRLPARLQDWVGKRVVVDGTCTANVVGFARVARLSGEPMYAGEEGDGSGEPKWTAGQVMDHGAAMLAAKLDGCTAGTWARDAALPAAVPAIPLPLEPSLAARARANLTKTSAADATAAKWRSDWPEDNFAEHLAAASYDARLVLHPVTGARWLIAHAWEGEGCGSPHLNITAVYRVGDDGSLTLTDDYDSELQSIDQILDIDNDGRFELRTMTGFLADPTLTDRDGTSLSSTSVPYFGCPC